MGDGALIRRVFGVPPVDLNLKGEADRWELVSQTSSDGQGWMTGTARLAIPGGWLYQTNVYQRNPDHSASVAVSTVFVPTAAAPAPAGKKPA